MPAPPAALQLTSLAEPGDWSSSVEMTWLGPADDGTLIVRVGGVEVERYEHLTLDAPCCVCGEHDPAPDEVTLVGFEPRVVHASCREMAP